MGMFDTLLDMRTNDHREGQVKCWGCEMKTFTVGDDVPTLDGMDTYSIALREGGYARIESGIFTGIFDIPLVGPQYDKYGDRITTADEFYGSENDPFSRRSLAE